MILGIDFGTCYSSVAIMIGENEANTTFFKEQSELGIPSKFLYNDGQKYFGMQCESVDLKDYREEIIDEMKKKIREKPENIDNFYSSGGKDHRLKNVIKDYLNYLITHAIEDAKNEFGIDESIEEITITMPAGTQKGKVSANIYSDYLRETIQSIVKIPGKHPEEHIHVQIEPCMAAMTYLYRKDIRTQLENRKRILVFDLGGGTFDISVVEYDGTSMSFEILGKDGDLDLGGYKWDEALENFVCSKYSITVPKGKEKSFRDEIVKLKISLSKKEKSYIIIENEDHFRNPYEVTRDEFETATKEYLNHAMDILKSFVFENDIQLSELDKIVLVGGSSNMPQITTGILDTFPSVDPNQIELYQASTAISKGAAIYSKILNSSADAAIKTITDVASHTYGIRVFDPTRNQYRILNTIFAGTRYGPDGKIHATPMIHFTPPSSDKTRLRVRIFESNASLKPGIGGEMIDDLDDGHFTGMEAFLPVPLDYLQANEDFIVRIEMDLTFNGILELTFIDIKTDKRTSVKLQQKRK